MNSKDLSRSEGAECGTLLSFFGGEAGSNPPGLMPETRIAGPRSSASNRLVQGPCLGRQRLPCWSLTQGVTLLPCWWMPTRQDVYPWLARPCTKLIRFRHVTCKNQNSNQPTGASEELWAACAAHPTIPPTPVQDTPMLRKVEPENFDARILEKRHNGYSAQWAVHGGNVPSQLEVKAGPWRLHFARFTANPHTDQGTFQKKLAPSVQERGVEMGGDTTRCVNETTPLRDTNSIQPPL